MARPIEADPQLHVVAFRLTARQMLAAQEAAAAAALPVAGYARALVLASSDPKGQRTGKRKLPAKLPRKTKRGEKTEAWHTLRQLGVELVRQGRNLKQMQHRLNAIAGFSHPEMVAHIKEVDALLAKIRAQLGSA